MDGSHGEAPVVLRNLVKRFEDVVAVDGLNLEVRKAECLGLLGPNGAGKTTTLEILCGLQEPTSGDVVVLGRRWRDSESWIRARLGISLQETRFPERLTVFEILRLFRSFYPKGRRPEEVMEDVALADKANTWTVKLSGGQRQRLALGCALVGDPEILILDEPTTGLDPQARLHIGDLILAHRRRGKTTILSTHSMEEAQRLCDRVAIIDQGKVVAEGTSEELVAKLGAREVIELRFEDPIPEIDRLRALPAVTGVWSSGTTVLLATRDAGATVPPLLIMQRSLELPNAEVTTRRPTLEDLFVALTGKHLAR